MRTKRDTNGDARRHAGGRARGERSLGVLVRGDDIVLVLGSRKVAQIEAALAALEMRLSEEEIALLESSVPGERVAGTRYAEYAMAHLDSER
jgi:aryl-alcohol dehydrogenase-like predicted oxidoreductase